MPMPLIPDMAVFQRKLATLPLETYQAGETVLSAASTTGRLLILKKGAVAVVKEGVEIARVTEPGAVFGELSVLLDQPHTADVRALEVSQFHVADAATILRVDPIALLYVATVLAQRLDDVANGAGIPSLIRAWARNGSQRLARLEFCAGSGRRKGWGLRNVRGVPLPCVTTVSTTSNLGLPRSVTSLGQ